MTTNIQLQQWLQRFPDGCEIKVLVSEGNRCWSYHVSVDLTDMVLPDIQIADLTWQDDFDTVQFDIVYDYDAECNGGVKSITLGKHHAE